MVKNIRHLFYKSTTVQLSDQG